MVTRLQLTLNVDHLDTAIDFYTKLFGVIVECSPRFS